MVDCDSADDMFGEFEFVAKFGSYDFKNSAGLTNDFGTDAITWQQNDLGLQVGGTFDLRGMLPSTNCFHRDDIGKPGKAERGQPRL